MLHLIKRSLCVFSVLILTSLGLSAQAAEPKSYPLLCKGGSGMKIEQRSQDSLDLRIIFKKGTKAATAGLAQGTCAWSDRGMDPNEPSVMHLNVGNIRMTTVYTPKPGGFSASVAVSGRGLATRPTAGLRQIINAVKSGRQFQVYAYQKRVRRRNVLYVTKYGP